MKLATIEDFNRVKANNPYWSDRWNYLSVVVDFLKKLEFKTSLEIGAKELKLVSTSDTMDIEQYDGLTYLHDVTTKLPIEDKKYDILIALQVWEHLGDKKQEAFKEAMRVSKTMLLSFPYLWDCPKDLSHHNIGREQIAEWTLNKDATIFVANSRIFYYFIND